MNLKVKWNELYLPKQTHMNFMCSYWPKTFGREKELYVHNFTQTYAHKCAPNNVTSKQTKVQEL